MSNSHRMDNRDTNQMTVLTHVSGSYSKGTGFSWYERYKIQRMEQLRNMESVE